MLNPIEIKNYEFKSAGRNAYKADDVDTFFAEVVISYEKMYRENNELIKRISMLADRLEQYKNDEVDIKQAVISAQKAADIIIRDAQESIEDSKAEAEAILAAAKGEAVVIKQDAEKQAIVDSDLLMNLAKDKAEDIINKAKEKAHGILIAANNSANDKMGAANRTITSESLHYDMLKKEVSEFRASILAQYKAHIELISKLPELAVEEAAKLQENEELAAEVDIDEEALENPVFVEEEPEDTVLEFVVEEIQQDNDDSVDISNDEAADIEEDIEAGEEVVKTTLPFDFFGNDADVQFVDDGNHVDEAPVATIADDGSIGFSRKNPLPVEDNNVVIAKTEPSVQDVSATKNDETSVYGGNNLDFGIDDMSFESFEATSEININDNVEEDNEVVTTEDDLTNEESEGNGESEILREHSSYASFFDSIETIDVEDYQEEKPKHKGFFSRNK